MSTLIELQEEAFVALFQPVKNHLKESASFDWGNGYGTMFETYGDEHDYVVAQPQNTIWTLCSGEDGDYITSGYHFADRLGYFISQHPVPEGVEVQVTLPRIDDNGEEEANIHDAAFAMTGRVEAVIGDYDFCSSHQELDIEYGLYRMLGEARALVGVTKNDGTPADSYQFRQQLKQIDEQLARYEAQRAEFLAEAV